MQVYPKIIHIIRHHTPGPWLSIETHGDLGIIVRNLHINIPSWMDVWRKTQYFMGVQIDMSRCKICRVRNCGWWQAVVFDTKAQGSKYGKAYPVKCFKNLCLNQQTLIRISRCCNPNLVGGFKPPTSHGFLWVSKMTHKKRRWGCSAVFEPSHERVRCASSAKAQHSMFKECIVFLAAPAENVRWREMVEKVETVKMVKIVMSLLMSSAAPHRLGEPPLVNWAMEVINQLPRGTHWRMSA